MYHKKNTFFYPWVEEGDKASLLNTDHSQGVCIKHLSLERRMAVLLWDDNKGGTGERMDAKSPEKQMMLPNSPNRSIRLCAQGLKEISVEIKSGFRSEGNHLLCISILLVVLIFFISIGFIWTVLMHSPCIDAAHLSVCWRSSGGSGIWYTTSGLLQ